MPFGSKFKRYRIGKPPKVKKVREAPAAPALLFHPRPPVASAPSKKGPPVIATPNGVIVIGPGGMAELTFTTHFNRFQNNYTAAQKFVDSEVLRLCESYIPLLTSMLIKSGVLGTDVGSGEVSWITPYAHAQYHSPRKPGSVTGPLRGPQWFARMFAASGKQIIAGAKKLAGGE